MFFLMHHLPTYAQIARSELDLHWCRWYDRIAVHVHWMSTCTGDNPRAVACGLSPVQSDKPCRYYFYLTCGVNSFSVNLCCFVIVTPFHLSITGRYRNQRH